MFSISRLMMAVNVHGRCLFIECLGRNIALHQTSLIHSSTPPPPTSKRIKQKKKHSLLTLNNKCYKYNAKL